MKPNEKLKPINVFSNIDGRTILSIKPNTAKNQGKSKKILNYNNFNSEDNTDGPGMKFATTTQNFHIYDQQMRNTFHTLNNHNQFFTNDKNFFNNPTYRNSDRIHHLEEKLKIKDNIIKKLEKKIKTFEYEKPINNSNSLYMLEKGLNSLPFDEMNNLFAELRSYVEKCVQTYEFDADISKKILKTLDSINSSINNIKSNLQISLHKDRLTISELRSDLDRLKEQNLILTNKNEKLLSELSTCKQQIDILKSAKKVEKIKKVIEAKSDTFLAKENEDLKRRMQIACNFLLEKKHKIEKQNDKITSLNRKINEAMKSNAFSEDEDKKIKEKIMKSLHSRNLSNFESNLTGLIESEMDFKSCYLDFRMEKLDKKYRKILKEILDNGPNEFYKHFFNSEKSEQEKLLEFISDQMLSYIDLSKRFLNISKFYQEVLYLSKEEIIHYVRSYLGEIFDAERSTLWILDRSTNEFYSIINFLKYCEPYSDPYFVEVLKSEKLYNRYTIEGKTIYSKNLEKKFSSQNTKSILSKGIVDNEGQVLGILEIVNSNNVIFGFDEEYLINLVCELIKWALKNFSKLEAEEKFNSREIIHMSVINIMSQKSFSNIFLCFESEVRKLLEACQTKLILVDRKSNEKKFFCYSSNSLVKQNVAGIAGISYNTQCGIFCKYPNEDKDYNPNIDIEIEQTDYCFYSIPLRKDLIGIYGVLQFVTQRGDSNDAKYKSSSSHQISKLDYYLEKIIEIISVTLQNVILQLEPDYFSIK